MAGWRRSTLRRFIPVHSAACQLTATGQSSGKRGKPPSPRYPGVTAGNTFQADDAVPSPEWPVASRANEPLVTPLNLDLGAQEHRRGQSDSHPGIRDADDVTRRLRLFNPQDLGGGGAERGFVAPFRMRCGLRLGSLQERRGMRRFLGCPPAELGRAPPSGDERHQAKER
jgi:hypothetical protein